MQERTKDWVSVQLTHPHYVDDTTGLQQHTYSLFHIILCEKIDKREKRHNSSDTSLEAQIIAMDVTEFRQV